MRHLAPSLAVLLAVAACGGDDNKNPPNDPNNPNNPATLVRVSQGAITEKTATSTSFRVNDTTYDAQGAKVVTVDDNPAGHEALLPGMVVSVLVDDKGAASEIRARSAVRGPVSAPTASSVTVGGQVVRFDDTTHFEDNTLRSGLGTAGRVRVSGFPDDRGGIRATRIGRDASSTEFEVHGVVSNLSGNGFTLAPSRGATQGWPVTLASGVSLPSGLANGSIVEVRAASAPAAAFGAITATSIKLDDDLSRLSGARQAEVEGYVTSISTPSATIPEFVIRGFTVRTAANTRWLGGGPADLLVGSKLEAEGSLDASGVLTATKITYRDGYLGRHGHRHERQLPAPRPDDPGDGRDGAERLHHARQRERPERRGARLPGLERHGPRGAARPPGHGRRRRRRDLEPHLHPGAGDRERAAQPHDVRLHDRDERQHDIPRPQPGLARSGGLLQRGVRRHGGEGARRERVGAHGHDAHRRGGRAGGRPLTDSAAA
jgi:hypothetical protein